MHEQKLVLNSKKRLRKGLLPSKNDNLVHSFLQTQPKLKIFFFLQFQKVHLNQGKIMQLQKLMPQPNPDVSFSSWMQINVITDIKKLEPDISDPYSRGNTMKKLLKRLVNWKRSKLNTLNKKTLKEKNESKKDFQPRRRTHCLIMLWLLIVKITICWFPHQSEHKIEKTFRNISLDLAYQVAIFPVSWLNKLIFN